MDNPENKDSELPEKQDDSKMPIHIKTFLRSKFNEPQHTVLSSPFARKMAVHAGGRVAPKWYKNLSTLQHSQFSELVDMVDDGRKSSLDFEEFVTVLQHLAPTVTREEVRDVLASLEPSDEENEANEADFGQFIYLLVNTSYYKDLIENNPMYKKFVERNRYTPRQSLFYSALSYHALIQTPEDIQRYYEAKDQRHSEVLEYLMASARNEGLNERQMEVHQLEARYNLQPLMKKFDSPYAKPVPFVPATAHEPHYAHYLRRRSSCPKRLLEPEKFKKPFPRPLQPIKMKRELGAPVVYENDEQRLLEQFEKAKITRPNMNIPLKQMKHMKDKADETDKPLIQLLVHDALEDYTNRLKDATVTFSKKCLKDQLRKGFPDDESRQHFMGVFKTYMPLDKKKAHIFFPWTPPTMWVTKPTPNSLHPAFQ